MAVITPCGIEMKVGQTWVEVDTRFTRQVTIVGFHEQSQRVTIKFAKVTTAALRRFHGKRGGYRWVRD